MSLNLIVGNSQYIELYNLVNVLYPTVYINNAIVTATIKDMSGADKAGSILMPYVTGSNGRYIGVIPSTTPIISGQYYDVRVVAIEPGGLVFNRTQRIKAEGGQLGTGGNCGC
jgi:hypothetical protein